MARNIVIDSMKLSPDSPSGDEIILRQISGQLYINDHLIITAENINSTSQIENMQSGISGIQVDISNLQANQSE